MWRTYMKHVLKIVVVSLTLSLNTTQLISGETGLPSSSSSSSTSFWAHFWGGVQNLSAQIFTQFKEKSQQGFDWMRQTTYELTTSYTKQFSNIILQAEKENRPLNYTEIDQLSRIFNAAIPRQSKKELMETLIDPYLTFVKELEIHIQSIKNAQEGTNLKQIEEFLDDCKYFIKQYFEHMATIYQDGIRYLEQPRTHRTRNIGGQSKPAQSSPQQPSQSMPSPEQATAGESERLVVTDNNIGQLTAENIKNMSDEDIFPLTMSEENAKNRYKRLSLRFHPDRNDTATAEKAQLYTNAFQRIGQALANYETLKQ